MACSTCTKIKVVWPVHRIFILYPLPSPHTIFFMATLLPGLCYWPTRVLGDGVKLVVVDHSWAPPAACSNYTLFSGDLITDPGPQFARQFWKAFYYTWGSQDNTSSTQKWSGTTAITRLWARKVRRCILNIQYLVDLGQGGGWSCNVAVAFSGKSAATCSLS